MKIALLVLLFANLKLVTKAEARGYLLYFLTALGIALPIVSYFVDLTAFQGSFANFEVIPWVTFWMVLPVSYYFLKDQFVAIHETFPQLLALGLVTSGLGLISLVLMELLYSWFVLNRHRKLYALMEIEFLLKFFIFTLLVFQQQIAFVPDEYLINAAFLLALVYFVAYSFVQDRNFFYLYVFNLCVLGHVLPEQGWIGMETVYTCSGLLAAKYVYSNLIRAKLAPALKTKIKGLESIELKLRLNLLKEKAVSFTTSLDTVLPKPKGAVVSEKRFVNDLASSLLICLLILSALVSFIIYRID